MDILKGFTHLNHASIKFEGDKTIYIDPYQIDGTPGDADYIFCTHDHFDHLSPVDIDKVINDRTILIVPQKKAKKLKKKIPIKDVIGVEPNEQYEAAGLRFETVPAYNVNKKFHKKKDEHVGFIIHLDEFTCYFAGDTDRIPEMDNIQADVIFLPVGGTYTMNALDAAEAANAIKPKIAVPIHFGSVVGTKKDAETFVENLDESIEGKILLKD
jgi:L-ascorbate metabolism protein UlaG (beta-lactamase superfamily)